MRFGASMRFGAFVWEVLPFCPFCNLNLWTLRALDLWRLGVWESKQKFRVCVGYLLGSIFRGKMGADSSSERVRVIIWARGRARASESDTIFG